MTPPRVSILLPARDAKATIGRAIESCLAQSFGDFELLVAEDNSLDGTTGVVEAFASRDPRIRPLRVPPPGGLVPALRLATGEAQGEIIARMDADDFSHPRRLEVQIALLDARPDLAAIGCGVRIIGSATGDGRPAGGFLRYESWVNGLIDPERIAAERFVESPLVHPSVAMRREALLAVGGYQDPPWPEDYDLWLRFLDAGLKLGKASEVLLDWTDGPTRLTRSDGRYAWRRFQDAKAHYLARLPALRDRGASICGAGPTGKRLTRLLLAAGIRVEALYDVHPRRVGERLAGIPILPDDALPAPSPAGPILLAAAGGWDASERLALRLAKAGCREGVDCFRTA